MTLRENIEADIKKAMLAKEKDKLTALRGIKSLILLEETAEGRTTALTTDDEIKILNKAVKQRNESLEMYKSQGRTEQAEAEQAEIDVIMAYLPKQFTDDELEAEIKNLFSQLGITSPKDFGKAMGAATKKLAGKAPNDKISKVIKMLIEQL